MVGVTVIMQVCIINFYSLSLDRYAFMPSGSLVRYIYLIRLPPMYVHTRMYIRICSTYKSNSKKAEFNTSLLDAASGISESMQYYVLPRSLVLTPTLVQQISSRLESAELCRGCGRDLQRSGILYLKPPQRPLVFTPRHVHNQTYQNSKFLKK